MPEISVLLLFTTAALALLLTPGPAVLYIVARSLDQGRAAGIVSAVGVGLGTMFHVVAAALGLSALLVSSSLAFTVVKYLGAAYLIYLGIQKLREQQPAQVHTVAPPAQPLRRIFTQGVIVNILNPKTALFFFAFLPQFIDPARGSATIQILLLGVLFVVLGMFTDSGYALLAGTARGFLRESITFIRAQRYVAGSIYIFLGLLTAFSGSRSK